MTDVYMRVDKSTTKKHSWYDCAHGIVVSRFFFVYCFANMQECKGTSVKHIRQKESWDNPMYDITSVLSTRISAPIPEFMFEILLDQNFINFPKPGGVEYESEEIKRVEFFLKKWNRPFSHSSKNTCIHIVSVFLYPFFLSFFLRFISRLLPELSCSSLPRLAATSRGDVAWENEARNVYLPHTQLPWTNSKTPIGDLPLYIWPAKLAGVLKLVFLGS